MFKWTHILNWVVGQSTALSYGQHGRRPYINRFAGPFSHADHSARLATSHSAATNGRAQANGNHHGPLAPVHHALEWFSGKATGWAGSSWALAAAVTLVVVWAVCGPIFNYSEKWQLTINTTTTIVTFLMVFLIQRAQNKESLAVQIKLNELLASQRGASNRLINVEDLSEDDIRDLHARFAQLADHLKDAADDGNPHSVNEAAEALSATDEKLHRQA